MGINYFELEVRGKKIRVPSLCVDDKTVIVLGKWLGMASVFDEEWLVGEAVVDPESFVTELKQHRLKADVFTFSQKLPQIEPKHRYHMEWDNVAAIPTATYSDWWDNRLPQETRKNVRRSVRRGVIVKAMALDDEFIRGIVAIYNETPIRQGQRFAHYGKDFDTIRKEVSPLLDRSEFIGAYFGGDLIGFIKLVYMGEVAGILHIVSMNKHYDKRPTNALIAKAVEICNSKGIKYLVYGKYTYGNKTNSPLSEFKRRNGFQKVLVPRYYVPLSLKGRISIKLKLHRGLLGLLPADVITSLLKLRSQFFQRLLPAIHSVAESGPARGHENDFQTEPERQHSKMNEILNASGIKKDSTI